MPNPPSRQPRDHLRASNALERGVIWRSAALRILLVQERVRLITLALQSPDAAGDHPDVLMRTMRTMRTMRVRITRRHLTGGNNTPQ